MTNLEAYKELELELASKLEAQYQYLLFNGDVLGAYQVLGKLMAYRLIDRSDERLVPKYPLYKKAGIDPADRFKVDLRRDSNYIPEWLFADIPSGFNTKLIMEEHMGERRDFGYVTGVIFPEREINIQFRLLNTPMSAKNALESVSSIFAEETTKKLNTKTASEEAQAGYSRIYELTISSNVVNKYKYLGYIVISRNNTDGLFHAKILLKSKVMQQCFIDITSACKGISSALVANLNMGDKLKVGYMASYSKAIKEQYALVKESKDAVNEARQIKQSEGVTGREAEKVARELAKEQEKKQKAKK